MSLPSLEQILNNLTQQPGWEKYQQYRQLLQSWDEVVSPKIKQNTRVLYVSRGTLWVAVSSSVWAQEISFRRFTLIEQLNARLPYSLRDLRCSPQQWQQSDRTLKSSESKHPSQLPPEPTTSELPNSNLERDPQAVVRRWADKIEKRSHHLPLCPQCHCPTPEGELSRWNLCHHCVAQKWTVEQDKYYGDRES